MRVLFQEFCVIVCLVFIPIEDLENVDPILYLNIRRRFLMFNPKNGGHTDYKLLIDTMFVSPVVSRGNTKWSLLRPSVRPSVCLSVLSVTLFPSHFFILQNSSSTYTIEMKLHNGYMDRPW